MGTSEPYPEAALMAQLDADTVMMMGDNPALPAMPERPMLLDFFKLRFSGVTRRHLLGSAKRALAAGHEEKVVIACLLHDIANGCLQFSIIGGDDDVSTWPEYIDETRFKRFLRGYDEVMLLSQAEIQVIPWLMAEALIAEAVFPIAATGSFGRLDGLPFLRMVQKKVYWITHHADKLVQLAEG